MAATAPTFATFSLASDPPAPISATISGFTGEWSCTFDQPLQSGALNAANWLINANNTIFAPTTAVAAGTIVSGASTSGFPNVAPDTIAYAPPPFDVLNAANQAATAFADFPVVVT